MHYQKRKKKLYQKEKLMFIQKVKKTRNERTNHTLEENVHIYVSDRGLVSGIHKELLQISEKEPNNLIFKKL